MKSVLEQTQKSCKEGEKEHEATERDEYEYEDEQIKTIKNTRRCKTKLKTASIYWFIKSEVPVRTKTKGGFPVF